MVTCTGNFRPELEKLAGNPFLGLKILPVSHTSGKETNSLLPPSSPPLLNPSAQVEAH